MRVNGNGSNAAESLPQLRPFAGAQHEPFFLEGGNHVALLIHGFPGTADELRRVGTFLHEAGWSVEGMLLPGFGADFAALGTQSAEGWLYAVRERALELRGHFDHLLLVGNSMGAALALQVAATMDVDGLILFAPFWRVNSRVVDAVAPLAFRVAPTIRPFRKANFADPRTAEMFERVVPQADLNDPVIQSHLREVLFPVSVLGEAQIVGKRGYAAAAQVQAPVLILQGSSDPLAHPDLTAQIAQRLPQLAGYVVVDAGHELAHMNQEHETQIAPLVRRFGELVVQAERGIGVELGRLSP